MDIYLLSIYKMLRRLMTLTLITDKKEKVYILQI